MIQAVRGKHGYTITLEELSKLGTFGPSLGGRPSDTSPAGGRTDVSMTEMALAGLRTAQEQTAQVLDQLRVAHESRERAERQLEFVRGEYRQAQLALTETAEILKEVETSRRRVDWLEKRVPRWVRGLFGAK